MRSGRARWFAAVCLLASLAALGRLRAEVVEEIVAEVNGDIITKSEMEEQEQSILAETYRRYTGPELDAQVKKVRGELLDRMIDRKILVQRASRLFDLDRMQNMLLESFKEQEKIKSDEELERMLAQDGMTVTELKKRLVDMYAPEEIIRMEVIGRVSVSDKEVAAYYEAHPDKVEVPAKATLREIVLKASDDDREQRRKDAQSIRERVTAPGADFAAIAAEVSDAGTKSNGGLLGTVGKGDLAPELERAAFTVPVGEVSEVIEMGHGFHLIKVEERTDTHLRTLEETKEEIRSQLEQEKSERSLEEFLKKARKESDIRVSDAYRSRLQPAN